MKIEVLVSTMFNDAVIKLVNEMNIETDCIVVNQCDCKKENVLVINNEGKKILLINSPERGLSRSRNKALNNLSDDTDIIIFTDDDIVFEKNYKENIIKSYNNYPKADGIVFNVRRANGRLNKKIGKKINQINLSRACSVSLTFKRKSINGIYFDENFGTGSGIFCLGEENIFVSDCLKNNLNICVNNNYVMCNIVEKRPSTWRSSVNKDFLVSKGASFKRMHKFLFPTYNFMFGFRKYKLYKNNFGIFKGIHYLFEGSNKLKKIEKMGNNDEK